MALPVEDDRQEQTFKQHRIGTFPDNQAIPADTETGVQ